MKSVLVFLHALSLSWSASGESGQGGCLWPCELGRSALVEGGCGRTIILVTADCEKSLTPSLFCRKHLYEAKIVIDLVL